MDWINELRAGDKVIMELGFWTHENVQSPGVVTKVTKTQIVVGERRFRKDSGYMIADTGRLKQWTQGWQTKYDNAIQKQKLYSHLKAIKWDTYTLPQLKQIAAFVEEVQNDKLGT